MNYYIATDRFGNYDLCHYGVKGMEWGNRKADLQSISGMAKQIKKKVLTEKASATSKVKAKTSSTAKTKSSTSASSNTNKQKAYQEWQNYASEVNTEPESEPETQEEESLDSKIEKATETYKKLLTEVQKIARESLSSGVSLGANPKYLLARKMLIKAKYELIQLNKQKSIKQ